MNEKNTPKRRVLFLIYSLSGGGAQRVLIDTVNALCEDETYDITVQTLFHEAGSEARLREGIHYRAALPFGPGPVRKLASGVVQYILPPRWVYRWLCRGEHEVEIAFMEAFPTKILAYSTNRRAKKLAWVHIDMAAYTAQDRLFRSPEHHAQCYRQFDRICCVSASVRDAFVQRFGLAERTCVVYNQLDPAFIRAQSRERCADLPAARPLLVSIGSLTERKGFVRLLHACAKLKRDSIAFHLLILGEGEQRRELEQLIRAEKLTAEVSLPGFRPNPYPYLATAELYVCSSTAEGYSTAASEALVLGVPVVTTACAGMAELLGGGEYGLITENSEDALYEGIRCLLQDDALRTHYRTKAVQRGEFLAARAAQCPARELLREIEKEK